MAATYREEEGRTGSVRIDIRGEVILYNSKVCSSSLFEGEGNGLRRRGDWGADGGEAGNVFRASGRGLSFCLEP